MFSLKDAVDVANELGIKFENFSFKDLLVGMNIELEHGTRNPITNITNDDKILTAKIALAHLMEYPNYYDEELGVPALEKKLSENKKNEA